MNRVARLSIGLTLLLVLGVFAVASLVADEPDSAFTGDGFLADDGNGDVSVQRLSTGPLALANEPGHADAALVVTTAPNPYGSTELDAIDDFLQGGGTVVVTDTRGHGTQITARHGISFERVRMIEPGGQVDVAIAGGTLRIATTNASALLVEDASDVLSWSSPNSFLDRDGNGSIGKSDPQGPFPVVVRRTVGAGTLWAIATPDVFDPNTEHLLDETSFRRQVFAAAGIDTVLIDESRISTDDPLLAGARIIGTLGRDPWRWILVAAVSLGVLATTLGTHVPGLRPHRFDARTFLARHDANDPEEGHHDPSGLTPRGRLALVASTALVVLGLAFSSPQATWAGALLFIPTVAAFFVRPPRATGVRTVSTRRTSEGAPVTVELGIRFKGPLGGVTLQDELPGFFDAEPAPALAPTRHEVNLQYVVRPARLGRYDIGPLWAERSDPLGLRVQVTSILDPNELRVTPRLEATRDAPFRTKVPQIISGGHQVNRAGSGSEFLALREYQTGDTMRMVNWKASARAKNLMVNQRVHESPMVLTLLLDVRRISDWGPADSTPFVRGARAAASIAQDTVARRDKLRILLYGNGIETIEGRGGDVLHRFQEHMAEAHAAGTTPIATVTEQIKTDLRAGQPVVVVTSGEDDPGFEQALEQLRRRDSPVHIVMPLVEDTGDRATAAAARNQKALASRLRKRGFNLYELQPGRRLEDSWRILGVA